MRCIGDKLRVKINKTYDPFRSHRDWQDLIIEIENELNNSPTSFGFKPNEAWGIADTISLQLPHESSKFNFEKELTKIQEKMLKRDLPSVTSARCLEEKLNPDIDLVIDTDGYARVTADGACSKNGDANAIEPWEASARHRSIARMGGANFTLTQTCR